MPPENLLHVYPDSSSETSQSENNFIIEEELKGVSSSEREEIFAYFTQKATEIDDSFPLFEALWPHIVLPVRGRGSLLTLILVYRRLDTAIDANNYTSVVTHELEPKHRKVVNDVCNAQALPVQHETSVNFSKKSLFDIELFIFFFDQIFSLLLSKVYYRNSGSEIIFFPFPNRFDSMKSVIKNTSQCASVVVSPLTSSWILNFDVEFENADHVRPINTYTSFKALYRQLICFKSLLQQSIRDKWVIEQPLRKQIKADLGIDAPQSIHYACTTAIQINSRFILTYYIYIEAIEKEGCSSVVIGGMSPKDRLALAAAERQGLDLHYIPHTIICGSEVLPTPDNVTQFVSGSYAIDYLKDSKLKQELPDLVPAGRPYLDHLDRDQITDFKQKDTITVLLATQPFKDSIRKEFVVDTLAALELLSTDYNVIIKIHPSEERDFYTEFLTDQHNGNLISVESGNIEPFLEDSDLVITINSNVGLEGILKGVVTISYNKWTPNTTIFPYIEVGPIPLATTQLELNKLIESMSQQRLNELAENQRTFLEEEFELGNSSERIAQYLDSTQNTKKEST